MSQNASEGPVRVAPGQVAVITLDRPAVFNALNADVLRRLDQAHRDLLADPVTRAIVITGAGGKAFSAGADLDEISTVDVDRADAFVGYGQQVFRRLELSPVPVIAAVNGLALGGGFELVLSCAFSVFSTTASVGLPESGLGLIPGYGGTQRLARLVGAGPALELMLTGQPVSAAEALRLGLVNRVVPAAALREEVETLARTIASKPPIAARYIIEAVNKGLQMSMPEGLAFEAALFGLVASTEDMREGTRAFLEKRKPEFKGR